MSTAKAYELAQIIANGGTVHTAEIGAELAPLVKDFLKRISDKCTLAIHQIDEGF